MEMTSLTKVTISHGLQKKDITWGALGFMIGVNNKVLPIMKKALEADKFFDLDGVSITTKFELSKHQMN